MTNELLAATQTIERLQFALDAAGIGTWDLDPIHNTVVWDARTRELYGHPPEKQVSYEEVIRYIHPDDREKVMSAVVAALQPGSGGDYEVQFRTVGAADARVRWLYCKGKAYFDAAGTAYRFSGTAQDISGAVADRQQIVLAETIAQVALDNSGSGYFRTDPQTGNLEYSAGFSRILTGSHTEDLQQSDFINHIHPEDRERRQLAHEEALRTGKLDYEARTIWKDGSIRWMRAKGTYFPATPGAPRQLTGTIQDTTAENEQRHAVRKVEDLMRQVTDSSPTGLWLSDERGGLTYLNKTLMEWTGRHYDDSTLR